MANDLKVLIDLVVDKAKSRQDILSSLKELQKEAQLETEIKIGLSDVRAAKKELSGLSSNLEKVTSGTQRLNQANTMTSWLENNSRATKKYGSEIQKFVDSLKSADDMTVPELNKIKEKFSEIKLEAREVGLLGRSFGDSFKDQVSKFTQWVSITSVVMATARSLKQMKDEVIKLDGALVELLKVSDLTKAQLQSVTNEAFKMGKDVAKTGTDVIEAITEFKRAGYELNQSMEMAESALIMNNVADGFTTTAQSAGTLISVLKGFKMPETEILSIVDKINQVSNLNPVGFDNLSDGLERVSGTLYQAGNTIDQTLGLLTGGFSQLRNMEKVSTGLVSISMRLRGVGEDGEAIEGLSAKLQDSFKEIGIAIEDTDGNLRSTYDIMVDYAKILPTLTSKQKQYYGELAAGTRQITVWDAITASIKDVEKASSDSIDSIGSAAEENAKFIESIQGRIKNFESAFQSLSRTVVDSDFLKGTISSGTELISLLDTIMSKFGTLSTLSTVGAGILGAKGKGKTNFKVYNALSYKVA